MSTLLAYADARDGRDVMEDKLISLLANIICEESADSFRNRVKHARFWEDGTPKISYLLMPGCSV